MNVGAIIGGVVAGVLFFSSPIILVYYRRKRPTNPGVVPLVHSTGDSPPPPWVKLGESAMC